MPRLRAGSPVEGLQGSDWAPESEEVGVDRILLEYALSGQPFYGPSNLILLERNPLIWAIKCLPSVSSSIKCGLGMISVINFSFNHSMEFWMLFRSHYKLYAYKNISMLYNPWNSLDPQNWYNYIIQLCYLIVEDFDGIKSCSC